MSDRLFMKRVPVTVVQHGQESRKSSICVTVELDLVTSPVTRKVVVVRLTDEKDLLFLYHMKMTEDEYRDFKDEKRLVFGFDEFPQILVEYLDYCIVQDGDEDRELFAQLTFTSAERAEFHIMQIIKLPVSDRMPKSVSKNVKRDSILPLDLLRGSDNDVKFYLAQCLRSQQEQNDALTRRLSETEESLSDSRTALASRCQELNSITSNHGAKVQEIIARHSEELSTEKQKLLQLQSTLQQKHDRDMKEQQQAHLKIVKDYEARMHELETNNRDLLESKYKLEAQLRDLSTKVTTLEEDNQRMHEELKSARRDYSTLGSDKSEQERELTQLRMRVAILEQDGKVKDELVKRGTDDLAAERETKRKVEEELERKRRQLREQAAIIKEKANDINKANEIITKLQNDNIKVHNEVKLRRLTIVEQEKVMAEKVAKMEETRREVDALQTTLKQKDSEIMELKEKMDECVQKLRESRDKIKENENVIQYLSRNMNEIQLSQRTAPGTFEMASRLPVQSSSLRTASFGPTSSLGGNIPPASLTSSATIIPSPPSAASTSRTVQPHVQFQSVNGELPVPVNKSTPIGGQMEAGLRKSSPQMSAVTLPRDGVIDSKYFQPDEMTTKPPLSSGGGGSSLMSTDSMQRRSIPILPINNNRPPVTQNSSENPFRFGQTTQQPSLASSYFPRNS